LFLPLARCRLEFSPAEAIATVETLAAGSIDEPRLAAWFRPRIIDTGG
jgi:prophage maintenance system killer protein